MGKLYGPSDFQNVSVRHEDGTVCNHDLRKGRHPMPGMGNDTRTLPVVNCAKCHKHLLNEGFHTNPDRVRRTADEIEAAEQADKEGSLYQKLVSQQLGQQLGKLIANGKE